MHDIWSPWHGCVKCSEGCAHCYMYFLDSQRGHNGAEIYRTDTDGDITFFVGNGRISPQTEYKKNAG